MIHSGKARRAALKLVLLSLIGVILIWAVGALTTALMTVLTAIAVAITPFLVVLWVLFAGFTFYFFRDPNPRVPAGANLVLSPAHGTVDVIDTATEPQFMGGECQRLSIFLSVMDVHVQNAPVTGRIAFFKYTPGQFLNALKAESAAYNENVLLGIEASEPAGHKVGVRVIARRIVLWVQQGDELARGQRISLIQFGSRTDVYLPRNAKIKVNLKDHVAGGETVLATFD